MSETREITVGLSISLSGRYSLQGRQAFDGIRLWNSYVNELGGLHVGDRERQPVQLIYYDDQSRISHTGRNIVGLLEEDRVDVLFGPYSSGLTLAAADVARKHGKVLWNHGGSADEIFHRGFGCLVSTPTPASDYLRALPTWLVQNSPHLRRICIVYSGKGTFASHVVRGLHEAVESLGHHQIQSVRLNSASVDQAIDQIHSLKPEVFVLAARFQD